MKPTLVVLALVLVAGLPAFAADPASAPSPSPTVVAPHQGELVSKLQDITAQLGLSEEQKAKIAPIVQQEMADLRALKQEATAARREKLRRFRDINQKASGEIRVLLTPAQQKKYDELRAAAKAEFKQRMKERRAAAGS